MRDDAELDGLVIRNIGDISAAIDHARKVLEPRIWKEAGKAVAAACGRASYHVHVDPEEENVWLAERSWLIAGTSPPDADFWLVLGERAAAGGDGENSWLATFTASGPNGASAALWVDQSLVGRPRWRRIVRESDELVDELRAAGFEVDGDDDRRLCVPVKMERDALAEAFATGDFATAMRPLAVAMERVVAAGATLGRLRAMAEAAS